MQIIYDELQQLNKLLICEINKQKSEISENISDFISSKSKKIRPSLVFLLTKSLNKKITPEIMNLSVATELIHNATLIHDDIIDNATKRRGKISLNIKLGNNLSVLAGDFLLSIAMKKLNECDNSEVIKIFSTALSNMCIGEINQQFSLNKVPTIQEYIVKSQNKTAELFIASLKSMAILLEIQQLNEIYEFAKNYGIAFQLKDDLMNILQTDLSKPNLSDIYNGNYTLPVIYFAQENSGIDKMSKPELIDKIVKNSSIIDKTKNLIKDYSTRAIASLEFIEDNQYKAKLVEMAENLYKAE